MVGAGKKSRNDIAAPALLCLLACLVFVSAPSARAQSDRAETGWVCGYVLDESYALIGDAQVKLFRVPPAAQDEPAASVASSARGEFCLKDLEPGFYELRVVRAPWPEQPPREVEVRAGLVNRLDPIELELEPGEPRVSFEESFDSMSIGEARSVAERLLRTGDVAGVREVARRLLPKRGVRIDVGRILGGMDTKALLDELMRQIESGYLPPLKTARYLLVIGEMADRRTREPAMRLLLAKLADNRRLPALPGAPGEETGQTLYVGDFAMEGVERLAGKSFGWRYGRPPMQNSAAMAAARQWWREESERRQER